MFISEMSRRIYDELARGWNTWDVRSVCAQVKLPEKLRINFSFIVPQRNGYSGNACWESIETFGDHTVGGAYTSVDIKFLEGLWRVETAGNDDELLVRITPLNKRPGSETHIAAEVSGVWGSNPDLTSTDEGISARIAGKSYVIKSLGGRTRPEWDPVCAAHFTVSGLETQYFTVNSDKTAAEIDAALENAHKTWLDSVIHTEGDLGEGLKAMQRALLWNMVYESRHDRVITPVSRNWCRSNGNMFGDYVLFDWDTFFAAVQYALIDKKLAYSTFFSMLEEACDNGMVPNFGCATGPSADRSEPQVGTLCAMRLYAQFGEKEFLEAVFEPLYRWNKWRFENRDGNSDGLMELGSEPFTGEYDVIKAYGCMGDKLSCQLESGIDNSTMFDRAKFNEEKHCLEQSYVGLNALMSADSDLLMRMAEILGKTAEAEELRARRDRLNELINRELWSEKDGIYLNKSWDGEFDPTLSLTHFYMMLTGAVTDERREKLMRHMRDENEFWGEYVIPNIARCDPSFKEQNYWRGRIWAPTNFLVGEGLQRMGEKETWNELAEKGLKMFVNCWRAKGAVGENYNAECGLAAEGNTNSDKFYHWGALLVYMALQRHINFNEWTGQTEIGEKPEHPICGVPVGNGKINL